MSWSEVVVVGLYVIREGFSSIWIQYLKFKFYPGTDVHKTCA